MNIYFFFILILSNFIFCMIYLFYEPSFLILQQFFGLLQSCSYHIFYNNRKSSMTFLWALSFLTVLLVSLNQNLVINGDFQNCPANSSFTAFTSGSYIAYWSYSNNFTAYSWYDKGLFNIQFQRHNSPLLHTTMVDLCTNQSTILCQDILLEKSYYSITYDVCKNPKKNQGYYSLDLGNKIVVQNSLLTQNACINKNHVTQNIQAGEVSLCFRGCESLTNAYCSGGPLIDNVTLFKLTTHQIIVAIEIDFIQNLSNKLLAKTNITLSNISSPQAFTYQQISQLFSSFTVNGETKQSQLLESQENKLQLTFDMSPQLKQDNISVQINPFLNNNNYYIFKRGPVKIKSHPIYLSQTQKKIVQYVTELNKPIALRVRDTIRLGRVLGIGYLFFDLFTFWQLSIFHNYLYINTPYFMKIFAENNFKNFLCFGLFSEMQIDSYVYDSVAFPLTEKLPKSNDSWAWFRELGFTSNFYKNCIECVFLLSLGILKSGLTHLIYVVTGNKYFKMTNHWFQNLTLDFVSWIPIVGLVPFIMIKSSSHDNFAEKVNFLLNVSLGFVCIIFPFLYLASAFGAIDALRTQKNPESEKKANKIQRKALRTFLHLIFVVLLTISTAICNKELFMITSYVLILARIRYTIKFRKTFYKMQFLIVLSLQFLWFLYTSIFLCFRVIQVLQQFSLVNMFDQFVLKLMKYLGLASLFLFTLGGWIEIVYIVFLFVRQAVKFIVNLLKYIKKLINKMNKIAIEQKASQQKSKQKKDEKKQIRKKKQILVKAQFFKNQNGEQPIQNSRPKKQVSLAQNLRERYKKLALQIINRKQKVNNETAELQ